MDRLKGSIKQRTGLRRTQQANRARPLLPPQERGATRDLFVDFHDRRRRANDQLHVETERIESLLGALRIRVQSPSYTGEEDTPKKQSSLSSLWGKLSSSRLDAESSEVCKTCNDRILASTSATCDLCTNSICNKCPTYRLGLRTRLGPREFTTCRRCDMYQKKWRKANRCKKAVADGPSHSLVELYTLVDEIRRCVLKNFPVYQALVSNGLPQLPATFDVSKDPLPEEYRKARKYDKGLGQFLENYQLGVQKLREYKPTGKKEAAIQANVVRSFIQSPVMKKFQPLYRVLHKALVQKFPKKKAARVVQEPNPTADSAEKMVAELSAVSRTTRVIVDPMVTKLEPAECKLEGGDMILCGTGFHPLCKVTLGGVEVECTHVSDECLYIVLPPMAEGSKNLDVRNPDGGRDFLDKAVLYSSSALDAADADGMGSLAMEVASPGFDATMSDMFGDSSEKAAAAVPRATRVNKYFLDAPKKSGWGEDPYKVEEKQEAEERSWGSPTLLDNYVEPQVVVKSGVRRATYTNATPSITAVTPALSPLSGTLILITGLQFAEKVKVTFGGKKRTEASTVYRMVEGAEECEVRLVSPPLPEGFHTVEVANPGGGKCSIPAILYTAQIPDGHQEALPPPRTAAAPVPNATAPAASSQQGRRWG